MLCSHKSQNMFRVNMFLLNMFRYYIVHIRCHFQTCFTPGCIIFMWFIRPLSMFSHVYMAVVNCQCSPMFIWPLSIVNVLPNILLSLPTADNCCCFLHLPIVNRGKWLGRRQTLKEETKRPRFMLESPRPCTSFVLCSYTMYELRNCNGFGYLHEHT